ncbi:unnamed protein product [Didymodactylos carnosus]|uniref:Uncharacterized protein n=1 Tax=Didymodactylos carnosus TaxID=1234261 RepID=A0A8S2NZN6_9BILA|nr:unnamed protein product [Didymodactylos carnosus]CAF4025949.1 unnamed protein product [Didymodactylos carnosus]
MLSAQGPVLWQRWGFREKTDGSQVRDYLRIVCALINAYGSPMVTPSPYTDKIAKFMLTSLKQENRIRLRVDNNQYNWKDINASNLVSFPVLTLDEIRSLTLGSFQIKQARSYAEEHCSTTDLTQHANYIIQICAAPDLIRIKLRSRHITAQSYWSYIQFSQLSIEGSCCNYKTRNRTVETRQKPSGSFLAIFDDSIQVSGFYDSTDEEDNATYSLT